VVQLGEQLADGSVEIFEREELPVAQGRHNPALGDLHCVLHFGFIEYQQLQAVGQIPRIGSGSPIRFTRCGGPSTISSFGGPIGEKIESSSMTLMAR
jgi:hypothetical protein